MTATALVAVLMGPCALFAQEPAAAPDASAAASQESAPETDAAPSPRFIPRSTPEPASPTPAAPGARLAPGAAIPPSELETFVDGVVRQAMLDDHIPGVAVSVVQGGQTVLKKGYGFAALSPGRPVDPDRTLFRIGAISKVFTWIAVLGEIEHGRMRPDAPINLYLPETLQIRDQGYERQVRVQDLLDHAEGFEDRSLGRLYERQADRVRPLSTYLRQERPRRVRMVGGPPEYSDYGAALAGAAVSHIEGRPFEDLIEAQILRPLNLDRTSFREPYPPQAGLPAPMTATMAADLAQGFRWTGAAYQARPFEYMSQIAPAESASASAGDMARLMSLILADGTLDGASLYGPQTARALRTVMLRAAPGVDGWANGMMERQLPGGFQGFGHTGQTLSFRSNLITVPALGLGVFVAGDSDTAARLAERLPDLIVEQFYAPPPAPPPPGSAELADSGAAYAGDYLTERRRYGGLEKFISMLTGSARMEVTRDGQLVIRSPESEGVWAPADAPGQFRSTVGEQPSAFQMQDGQAVRWFSPSGMQSFARAGLLQRASTLAALALASLIAAGATLLGLLTRDRRDFRQTSVQGRASALQTSTAILWFAAAAAFGVWAAGARADYAQAFYAWPSPLVLVASACALVASLCSAALLIFLPVIWRGGRRLDSWTVWRKLRFSVTTLVFLSYSALLLLWGALEPWSV